MRFLFFLLPLFFCFTCFAQQAEIKRNSYADRYYYIDSLSSVLHKIKFTTALDTINILTKKAEDAGDIELSQKLKLLNYIWQYLVGNRHNDTIANGMKDIVAYAHDNNLKYIEADALQAIGNYYWGDSKKESVAIENFAAAYNLYKNFNPEDYPGKQANLYVLGGTYYRYEDYDNAIKYLREAGITKASRSNNLYCTIYNTIGLCYRKTSRYDSAEWYFKKVYDSSLKDETEKLWTSIAGGNIGITYFYKHKYAEAIPLIENDITSSLATHQIKNAATSMSIRAAIYYEQKDYENAEKLLLKALNVSYSAKFWPFYPLADEIYTRLSKVYAAKNDMKHAYIYADSALIARDSVASIYNALSLTKANEKIDFVQHKLDAEKLSERIKIDQLELAKKRIEITFFIIGLLVLVLVIIFIARERKRSENLLLNILPEKIADRLKKREHPIADYFENASILFIDMAGFTIFSDGRDPKEIITLLNTIFTRFDVLAEKYGLEKIKTIGDCYMAVSGLPEPNPKHAEAAAKMALEIRAEMKDYKAKDGTPILFRMGLDCGPVVAGVIGRRKFIYDLWGDTVNTASRMETTGVAGEIHCSDRFKKKIEHQYLFTSRGTTEIKGKGMMETWLII